MPGSEFVVLDDVGDLIEREKSAKFFALVSGFVDRNR